MPRPATGREHARLKRALEALIGRKPEDEELPSLGCLGDKIMELEENEPKASKFDQVVSFQRTTHI